MYLGILLLKPYCVAGVASNKIAFILMSLCVQIKNCEKGKIIKHRHLVKKKTFSLLRTNTIAFINWCCCCILLPGISHITAVMVLRIFFFFLLFLVSSLCAVYGKVMDSPLRVSYKWIKFEMLHFQLKAFSLCLYALWRRTSNFSFLKHKMTNIPYYIRLR